MEENPFNNRCTTFTGACFLKKKEGMLEPLKQPECVYRIIRDIVFFEKSSGQDQWVYRRCLLAYYNMPTPVLRPSHAAKG